MALLQLGLPPYLQPRLSLAFPNPPFPLIFSSSFDPQISNARVRRRVRGRKGNLNFDQRFPLIAALSGSSTTVEAPSPAEEGSVERPEEPRRRLIAQNIPWTCTAEDIRNLFEKHGTVIDVELSMHNSSRNRGLAFITMASEEEALAALNNLDSYDLDGRVIKVEFSTSLKKNPSAPSVPVEKYNVFVGSLAWRVRSQDLRELFSANGSVLSAEVIFQTNPRRSAGYGFVSFSSKEAAESAIATFNGKRLMGRPIRLAMKENQTYDAERKSNAGEQFAEALSEVNAGEDLSKESVEM